MGTMNYQNGDKYVGRWRDDAFHYEGCYFYADGSKYEGKYANNAMDGKGKLTDAKGKVIHEGEFRKGIPVK